MFRREKKTWTNPFTDFTKSVMRIKDIIGPRAPRSVKLILITGMALLESMSYLIKI